MKTENNSVKTLPQQMMKHMPRGLGLWRLFVNPRVFVVDGMNDGFYNTAMKNTWRKQMEEAAYRLKPVDVAALSDVSGDIHFLTGRKFWYQTLFCAYSMIQCSGANIRPVIYDDGSLEQQYVEAIRRVIPTAKFVLTEEIESRLEDYMPQSKFPYLRQYRSDFNVRKFTDIHASAPGWKLYLDSDMLFFREPEFLLKWFQSPQQPCYMMDIKYGYSYTDEIKLSLTGAPLPERLNAGLYGIKSEDVDWEQLEAWCKTLVEAEGHHYFLEQTLTAMLLAGKPSTALPQDEYVVWPSIEETKNPRAVMHHYVGPVRHLYFRYAWKHVARF